MKKLFLSTLILLAAAPLALAVEENQIPPQCAATLAGSAEKLDIGAYKGKVLLIDFWATWCPPCKKSMPFLNGLRNEHLKDGFEIIAINVDENSEEAKQFLGNNPVDYVMAFDPKGDCPAKFDVKAMPSSYLVDKTGKIRKVHLGFRDEDQAMIREQVSALLAE
jgi:thiol-disulfide isomerase/thioredoxin